MREDGAGQIKGPTCGWRVATSSVTSNHQSRAALGKMGKRFHGKVGGGQKRNDKDSLLISG